MNEDIILNLEDKLKVASGKDRVDILNELSRCPTRISPNKAIQYAEEALELSKQLSYSCGEALALRNIGFANVYLGDCHKSIEYSLKALQLLEKNNSYKEISITLSNLGAAYGNLSDYDMALEYYFKSLELEERLENQFEVGNCLRKIGIVYWCLEDYDNSLEFCQKALPIHENTNNFAGIASTCVTMGLIYKYYNNHEKTLKYLTRAYDIAERYDIKDVASAALINIGSLYCELGDYNKALDYYFKSLEAHEFIGYKAGIATNLLYIGKLYTNINDLDKSLQYLEKSLEIAKEVKIKKIINEIYAAFSEYYEKTGAFKNALSYFKLYSELKDSIFTEDSRKKISRLQNKYQLENKEKENEIYRLKNVELVKANKALLRANDQIRQQNKDLLVAYNKLELMAKTDYLTNLWNRMYILEKIEYEKLRFKETQQPFVIILADIDHFKQFNDTYGHECGDFILVSLSQDMQSMIRNIDCLCRWGGEEFLFFLPNTSLETGYTLAEKMRSFISNKIYKYKDKDLSVTLTFGVCEYNKEMHIDYCIGLADSALYEGKRSTKNCVVKAKG